MRPAFGSTSRALELAEEAVRSDRRSALAALCSYARGLAVQYSARYDEDDETDLSLDILWLFSAEVFGQCRKHADGLIDATTIRGSLAIWIPFLAAGQEAWETVVKRGDWPFTWSE
jgi:hypothetical protein